jgi:hypothetical protein
MKHYRTNFLCATAALSLVRIAVISRAWWVIDAFPNTSAPTAYKNKQKGNRCFFRSAISTLFSSTDSSAMMSRADVEASLLLANQEHLQEDASMTVENCGVVRLNGVISKAIADELKSYVDQYLVESITEVESFRIPRSFRFANVLEKQKRWDLLLPFEDNDINESSSPIMQALDELLNGRVGDFFEDLLGEKAVLYELSCLVRYVKSHVCTYEYDVCM